jgi:hypothetical protein
MKFIFTSLCVVCLNFSIFGQTLSREEYRIYGIVLDEVVKNSERFFVISDATEIGDTEDAFESVIPYKSDDERIESKELIESWKPIFGKLKESGAYKNYNEKNKASVRLQNRLLTRKRYRLLKQYEIDKFLNVAKKSSNPDKHRQLFSDKFQKAYRYYQFSRIGFNSDKQFAIVKIKDEGKFGSGLIYYILRKVNNWWKIYASASSYKLT